MEGRVLADEKQRGLLTLDEIKKADRNARLDFEETIEADTNLFEVDSRPLSRMELVNTRFYIDEVDDYIRRPSYWNTTSAWLI